MSEPETTETTGETTRAGVVALAGTPNVGKSTLLNRILGCQLSIATPKPQTTRQRILGIHTRGNVQVAFVDTPGVHGARGLIHERMRRQARTGIRDADLTCWLVDATRGLSSIDRRESEELRVRPTVVVLNKIDRVARPKLLPLMGALAEALPEAQCFPVSALRGEGVDTLLDHLESAMPEGEWLFDAGRLTDQPEQFRLAELVREQLFLKLRKEMPYRVAVRVEECAERGKGVYIRAIIYTDTDSSKAMIVGRRGACIREVGVAARRRIERMLERSAYLDLHVKVRKGWQDDPQFLAELGL